MELLFELEKYSVRINLGMGGVNFRVESVALEHFRN